MAEINWNRCGNLDETTSIMAIENKELLLKDLCGRLPYDCIVSVAEGGTNGIQWDDVTLNPYLLYQITEEDAWEYVKPYLRQMEDMTEEECDMVEVILGDENIFDFMRNGDIILKEGNFTQAMLSRLYDYFNSIHVDYRGLIPKGLANVAPEGMYNN